jgi:hypothetical protein
MIVLQEPSLNPDHDGYLMLNFQQLLSDIMPFTGKDLLVVKVKTDLDSTLVVEHLSIPR